MILGTDVGNKTSRNKTLYAKTSRCFSVCFVNHEGHFPNKRTTDEAKTENTFSMFGTLRVLFTLVSSITKTYLVSNKVELDIEPERIETIVKSICWKTAIKCVPLGNFFGNFFKIGG